MGNLGKAGGGGVIRDHRGCWVQGFARKIGNTSSVIAEFCALRDGLTMAAQLGLTNLEVEMDAKIVIDLVLSNANSNYAYSSLLNDCRSLLRKFQQVKMQHVYREVNKVAYGLARMGCTQQADFVTFTAPPSPEVNSLALFDINDLYSLRRSANVVTAMDS